MKTRIIYTRFWHDNYISELNSKEKLAFMYLVTNEKVNICGIYELPDKYIRLDLNLKKLELEKIKQKFMEDNKFLFINGWIRIVNFSTYNKFDGEKNEIAKQKEMALIPKEIIEYQYSIDRVSSKIDTLNNHKSIISNINKKSNRGGSRGGLPIIEQIINYLNEKTGKNFKNTTTKTIAFIKARLNEGFNIDDFKKVIDIKTAKWKGDPKMCDFLRPETLFGTKFESYLNEKEKLGHDWKNWGKEK